MIEACARLREGIFGGPLGFQRLARTHAKSKHFLLKMLSFCLHETDLLGPSWAHARFRATRRKSMQKVENGGWRWAN